MAVTTLQQALDGAGTDTSLPTYNQQLDSALAFWQGIQAATADQGANFDSAADTGGNDNVTADATAAIAFIQAEITRIGGN